MVIVLDGIEAADQRDPSWGLRLLPWREKPLANESFREVRRFLPI